MMLSRRDTVLFLCTGNYYRSRFAEHLFNDVAGANGLPWKAESRGLAAELGFFNVGRMSSAALARLRMLGIPVGADVRLPIQVVEEDLSNAGRIIALKEAEHRPMVELQFPAWTERVEYWHIHDVDCASPEETLAGIEREVQNLAEGLRKVKSPEPRVESRNPRARS